MFRKHHSSNTDLQRPTDSHAVSYQKASVHIKMQVPHINYSNSLTTMPSHRHTAREMQYAHHRMRLHAATSSRGIATRRLSFARIVHFRGAARIVGQHLEAQYHYNVEKMQFAHNNNGCRKGLPAATDGVSSSASDASNAHCPQEGDVHHG